MQTHASEYRVVVSNVGTIYRGMNRGIALREYDESVAISKGGIFGRWHDEKVTLFEDNEILKEYDPGIQPAQPNQKTDAAIKESRVLSARLSPAKPITDEDRMNYLVMHIVDVRKELRYGSALMFTSQSQHGDDDEFTGTTLRAQIDEEITKERSKS